MKNVAVLMSTYNGEKYVKDQILSIFNQSFDKSQYDLKLYVRDDGSSDSTQDIVQRLSFDYNICMDFTGPNVGFAKSFYKLLNNAHADYYFFADQDDIWLPTKLSLFLDEFKKIENRGEKNIGVFSDAWVADTEGNSMGMKLLEGRSIRINNNRLSFLNQLFEFYAQGASMAINNSIIKKLLTIPFTELSFQESHDHFIGLVTSYIGYFSYINEPTLLYRQTGTNTYGARDNSHKSVLSKLMGVTSRIKTIKYLLLVAEFVCGFLNNSSNQNIYNELQKVNSKNNPYYAMRFFIKYRKHVSLSNPVIVSFLYGILFNPNPNLHQKVQFLIDRRSLNENNMDTSTKL